ncbi:hypothetical protein BaRGS_00014766 [Batillaria attramentaria]|uniref:Uncharacterized protein n=1 Tax=Batillaria attramentaria TaxID=370345 RepID=A0ABD0L436_9CAEN
MSGINTDLAHFHRAGYEKLSVNSNTVFTACHSGSGTESIFPGHALARRASVPNEVSVVTANTGYQQIKNLATIRKLSSFPWRGLTFPIDTADSLLTTERERELTSLSSEDWRRKWVLFTGQWSQAAH